MFDRFYGMKIVDATAYGVDDYDFTPNLLGFGTSVGETGYMEIVFPQGKLFFSTDGISETVPIRPNTHMLPTEKFREYIVGLKLNSIENVDGEYTFLLEGCKPITCYLEKNDGHCDRDYFSIDVFDPDSDLYL